jgi:hypothetical protein
MVERTRCLHTPILGLWQFWAGWSRTEREGNGVRFQVRVLVRLKILFLIFFSFVFITLVPILLVVSRQTLYFLMLLWKDGTAIVEHGI